MLDGQGRNDLDDIEQGFGRIISDSLGMILTGMDDRGED